jgi:hypothetical protein
MNKAKSFNFVTKEAFNSPIVLLHVINISFVIVHINGSYFRLIFLFIIVHINIGYFGLFILFSIIMHVNGGYFGLFAFFL